MKINLLLSFVLFSLYGYCQSDITSHKDFTSTMSVKQNSKIVPSTMFFNDGKKLEGTLVYESETEDPNFIYVDMQRFGFIENGKIKKERFKFKNLDSLLIDKTMYRIREIKIPNGLVTMTNKSALCRVIKDFKRTSVLMYIPTEAPFGTNTADLVPLKIVENKDKKKYFQPGVGIQGFTKSLSKFLDDCSSLTQELKDNKEKEPKKSILEKAMTDSSSENDIIMMDALAKYDDCKK